LWREREREREIRVYILNFWNFEEFREWQNTCLHDKILEFREEFVKCTGLSHFFSEKMLCAKASNISENRQYPLWSLLISFDNNFGNN